MIAHDKPYVRLSEQEAVDCANGSCGGGWTPSFWDWSHLYGSSSDADYPYRGNDGACTPAENKVSKVESYEYLPRSGFAME